MPLKILIVDDSQTVRTVISRTLNMADLPIGEIVQATNGKEALDILEHNWIDLVLCDLHMPVMTGMEMVNQMAQHNLLADIPVIIVSSEASQVRISELKKSGIRSFVHKPFTPEIIRNVIMEVMETAS